MNQLRPLCLLDHDTQLAKIIKIVDNDEEAQRFYHNEGDEYGWCPTVKFEPSLSWCLNMVCDENWRNPLHPYMFKADCLIHPFEAYRELKPVFQKIVVRLLGREPNSSDV